MSAVIQFTDVSKHYGSTVALENLSLDVPPGVVFALLGENGAGKTTAIRLMLGLTEPTAGEVRVLGLDSRRDGLAIRRRVGYLPERPTLYEWMTAAEIGWFTAGFYAGGFEHQFRTLVDGFRVPLDRKLSQLSKGMRAKVALSLAMAHQPELLDPRRANLRPRHDGPPRVPREHGRHRGRRPHRPALQPSDRRSRTRRRHRRHRPRRPPAGRRAARWLKETTRQITITVAETTTPPPFTGQRIYERRRGRQWEVLVRGVGEPAIEALQFAAGVVAVEAHTVTGGNICCVHNRIAAARCTRHA